MNDYEKLLKKITNRLVGINYDDLTKAERQIADLLIESGLMFKAANGGLHG